MILTFFIYTHDLQQGLSDSTVCTMTHFPSAPSCAKTTINDCSSLLHGLISTRIYIRYNRIMKKHFHLLLDFNEIFPHSTS